jgi:DNA-binding transcriptional ArsR family regulator
MTAPGHMSDAMVDLVARRFRLLAEPTRIQLCERLRDGEATVNELTTALGTSQQNISKQLSLMAGAGVLARRKDGNCAYYRLVDTTLVDLCEQMCRSTEHHLLDMAALVTEPGASERAGAADADS